MKIYSEILGKQIEIPDDPQRIVSLAPAITDTIYELGAGDKLAGVSVFCDTPPEAREKPRVGSYYKVNYRILEQLKPDLILVTTGAQRDRIYELEEKGYTVIPIPLPVNLYDILSNTMSIGIILNKMAESMILTQKMMARIHDLSVEQPIGTVYYEVDLGGPTSIGGITYIDHALRMIGLNNIFGNQRITWIINPDPEKILEKNPDYILYEPKPYSKYSKEKIIKELEERGLSNLKALREERLIMIKPNGLAHYGPALLDTLKEIKHSIH
ncbi:MAG: ABC transporter substrate-binding protein [Desulfurococcales archaeon]|nr:ABC transporter substrate-binding protein [Desulfurococcales archaeon]